MKIRAVALEDKSGWRHMFEGYCRFYEVPVEAGKSDTVWAWLHDPSHMFQGIVAEDDGQVVGLAHFHGWPDTLGGGNMCYLSDLFVDPERRGKKIGKALFEEVLKISRAQGWSAVSLLTHKTNTIGQNLYNQYGQATDYLFYVAELDQAGATISE